MILKKARKIISVTLILLLLCQIVTINSSGVSSQSSISLVIDKISAKIGETITAEIKVENILNFYGYQVNIKYDPLVLQPN